MFLDFLENEEPLDQDKLYLAITNMVKSYTYTKCGTIFPLYS
jgi:hypothetical protein